MYLTQTVAVRPLPLPLVKRTGLSHIICSSPEWKLVFYDRWLREAGMDFLQIWCWETISALPGQLCLPGPRLSMEELLGQQWWEAGKEQLPDEGAFPSSRALRKDEKLWFNGKHEMLCRACELFPKESRSGCLKYLYSVLTTHPRLRVRCQLMWLSLCPRERSLEPGAKTQNWDIDTWLILSLWSNKFLTSLLHRHHTWSHCCSWGLEKTLFLSYLSERCLFQN